MPTDGVSVRPVITVDVTQLETIMKKEKIKHANWVAINSEYLRFTPVLTPLLLANEERAVEKQVKEIQIVFKEIGRDAAEYVLFQEHPCFPTALIFQSRSSGLRNSRWWPVCRRSSLHSPTKIWPETSIDSRQTSNTHGEQI
jgi:hypothetical protein